MPLINRLARLSFRSGFTVCLALVFVFIQFISFSQVSNVLFEGESSSPDHHEARPGISEVSTIKFRSIEVSAKYLLALLFVLPLSTFTNTSSR